MEEKAGVYVVPRRRAVGGVISRAGGLQELELRAAAATPKASNAHYHLPTLRVCLWVLM